MLSSTHCILVLIQQSCPPEASWLSVLISQYHVGPMQCDYTTATRDLGQILGWLHWTWAITSYLLDMDNDSNEWGMCDNNGLLRFNSHPLFNKYFVSGNCVLWWPLPITIYNCMKLISLLLKRSVAMINNRLLPWTLQYDLNTTIKSVYVSNHLARLSSGRVLTIQLAVLMCLCPVTQDFGYIHTD